MGGGVSPYEWILPPVAMSHALVNVGAQQVAPGLKIETPDSKNARTDQALAGQRENNEAVRNSAAAQFEASRPQTAEEQYQSRLRSGMARSRSGEKRASQFLAGGTSALGV
jgi:hypothetical protein